ncbi:HNH endonuclease [Thermosulfidibacter takaii ABI70S6]|uniref:HNH endonuclease n=1 Tax=Thermosulfidibacter takaii (strain DSM 17441 / JCM 13301 / NBRC 103674 / ABI70S6) TaxID=1298851 RepID=A0A0S3QS56_THET7|nr:HNH endonuclease [Thermosulfidibacter takaii]BAT71170.1 HNH endonuclease [Thermosulfidibacter takaii ABI70S6]
MAKEDILCLVLNKTFLPFDIISWQKAITLEFMGRGLTIEYHPFKKVNSARKQWDVPVVIKVNSIRTTLVQGPPTRMMIYYRDGFKCAYCGKMLKDNELTIDHVVPKAKGGRWNWENLVTCCRDCNFRKKEEVWIPRYTIPAKPKFLFPQYIDAQKRVDQVTQQIWKRYIPKAMIKSLAK